MNPTQSDPPRTDAVESCVKQYAVPQFELLLHAQKIERELQQVTAELQAAKDWIHADSVRIGELRTGLTTLRARVAESATPATHKDSLSVQPATHPDTVREWKTGTPDVPVGAMRRLWCAVLADNGKIYHSILCYANGHAMPVADWVDTIPDCCEEIPGNEDEFAWFGWYEESCDHCETQWHSSAKVVAWMELPKFDAAMKGGAHD